ncbi:MAG: transketolase [Rhodothermales bacterium]|nr:transketolase [Rhodothermales bacterium]
MTTVATPSPETTQETEELCINTIRFLAVDAVQKANSGHPGLPMGCAPMAYTLWKNHLKHNPANPSWPDRDRFVLSAGHGSMLLYALLHLTGYDLSLDDLKNFRQLHSKTPGHPENFMTAGVETTTGPLGQGFANGVGMALAERLLSERFNKPGFELFDHHTYGIVSDGDLMEGISHEAASLAGHLGLGKLIYLYDDNKISIDGSTDLAFTEDVPARFAAYGWQVLHVGDGNDITTIDEAINRARTDSMRPSLISIRTIIGFGSPNKQGTASVHGSPLGPDEVALAKENLDWPKNPTFHVPDEVRSHFNMVDAGWEKENTWNALLESYRDSFPEDHAELQRWLADEFEVDWEKTLPDFETGSKMATRASSGKALNAIAPAWRNLAGGSADLTGSNKTDVKGWTDQQKGTPEGHYIRFGVREHAMASMCNGMALHGGIRPYCGTFLVFSDYLRPALRLAALMGTPVIFVLTHDSIGLGEDGPTHQPVEHYMALRVIPNVTFLRPGDARETAQAWRAALSNKTGPTVLSLTRQGLPTLEAPSEASGSLLDGAYSVVRGSDNPELILIATGSELSVALDAASTLADSGVDVRVVSMPSWEIFEAQSDEYKQSVLPDSCELRISVEAGVTLGWEKYVGRKGVSIGVDSFGASAPAEELFEHFGITPSAVVDAARKLLQ